MYCELVFFVIGLQPTWACECLGHDDVETLPLAVIDISGATTWHLAQHPNYWVLFLDVTARPNQTC